MNATIASRASSRRGPAAGLLDRLTGATPLDEGRQARFNRLHADLESAVARGDDIGAAIADNAISTLIEESRAARASNVEQATAEPSVPNFSGGYRGRRIPVAPARPGLGEESSGDLFARALLQADVERRDGRPQRTIVVPG